MAVTTLKRVQLRDGIINNAKVDAAAGIVYSKLDLTGGIVDADINASAAISLSKLAEAVIQADGGQAFTADQSMGGFKLTNLGTPTASTDAATKGYVDNLSQGISWKNTVRVKDAGANVDIATALENADTLNGVTLATGDRVLLTSQTAPAENGIYVVQASGAAVRATDADTWDEMVNAAVFVSEGTSGADTAWVCTSDAGGTLGTTALTFVQFSSATATSAASITFDPTGLNNTSATNVQGAIGDMDSAIGSRAYTNDNVVTDGQSVAASIDAIDTAIGNRTYTNDFDVTDGQTLTASIDALDSAHGNRTYTNDNVVTDAQTFTASIDAIDTAIGNRTYTENNVIADAETLSASLEKLDLAFGDLYATGIGVEGVGEVGDRAARYSTLSPAGDTLKATLDAIDSFLGGLETDSTPQVDVETGTTSATMTLSQTPDTAAGSFALYLNGVRLNEGASNDFTRSGTTVTFNITREAADVAIADYRY